MAQVGHGDERKAKLENDAANKRLRLAMEMDEERKARLEKMVSTTQLMLGKVGSYAYHSNLMFIGTHNLRNIDHDLLSASLILLYIYLITYTL